jgi:1-acyl-sn-glycerol-3-phosphate acyltransferase
MRVLYSFIYWTAFALDTIVCSTFVIILAILSWPFDRTVFPAHRLTTLWAASGFRLNPRWSLEARNRERLARAGASVICVNHLSQVDITALSTLHGNWRWASKAEMFWVPFLGWAMKAVGTPFVRRGDKQSGKRLLEQCRRWLDLGVSILIFPEGTRSSDGELLPFKPGAFKLALETGRPVLPIIIDGTREALPPKTLDVSGRAHVILSLLEPIDPAPWRAGMDVDGLSRAVHDAMAAELAKIRAERSVRAVGIQ